MFQKDPKVLIYMEGGVIQDVLVDGDVDVITVDFDVDGLDDEDIVRLPNREPAYVKIRGTYDPDCEKEFDLWSAAEAEREQAELDEAKREGS